jgi:hypothetical protein
VRRSTGLLLGAALAVAAPSCVGRGHGGTGGALRATQVAGTVVVQPAGQAARRLQEGDSVAPGTSVRTGHDGRVRLESGDQAVELAPDTQATIGPAAAVTLGIGRALAEAGAGSIAFDSLGVTVRVDQGATRLERLLGTVRLGVYSGQAHADLLGRTVDVPAYRESFFSGGIPLDRTPRPLQLQPTDPWDRRFLGDVLEMDRELAQFGRGFNGQFGSRANAPGFFAPFVAVPGVDSVIAVAPPGTTPADTLIGLVFARQLAARGGASVQDLFAGMLAENRAQATWGLIAKERGLVLPDLLQAVLEAIRRGTAPPPAGSGGRPGGGGPAPTPTTTATPKPKPTATASPSPSPSPTKSPPPPCTLLERLINNCSSSGGGSSGTGGGQSSSGCSIIGVLLDPNC